MHPLRLSVKQSLKLVFMPWTATTRANRAYGFLCFGVMILAVGTFFSDRLIIPCLLGCMAIGVATIVLGIHGVRQARRDGERIVRLLALYAVNEGEIAIEQLPPEIQEGVRMEYARFRLSRSED